MNRRGWTITETLIVIAVLALLTGLLMPALSSARAAGRGTQCQSNLRQMAIALQSYANLYDCFPTAIRYDNTGGVFKQIAWDWVSTPADGVVSPGPLWMFTDNPDRVMQCPAYYGHSNTASDQFTGYNYNTTYVGGEAMSVVPGWAVVRRGIRPAQCRRASTCAAFGCGAYAAGANKFMRAPLNSEGRSLSLIYSGGQAFRHVKMTHVAHLDGHVGVVQRPWEGELATATLLNQHMRFPDNGFLSNDDSMYDPR